MKDRDCAEVVREERRLASVLILGLGMAETGQGGSWD